LHKVVTGHDPEVEPRAFDPFSPVRSVTKDYSPIHGTRDTDVPCAMSVQMDKELKAVSRRAWPATVRRQ
jgi:hypothetical protein